MPRKSSQVLTAKFIENAAPPKDKNFHEYPDAALPGLCLRIYQTGAKSFIPVHEYLLIEQGVHILEFHYLEALAREKVYEFCYMATTNKIKGTTAGFTMRPIGLR